MQYVMLALTIILGAVGQILFKQGVKGITETNLSLQFFISCLSNFWILAGGLSYAASFLLWMYVLKYFEISFARPLTGAGYILTFIMAIIFLGEAVTPLRIIAVILITAGVIVLAADFTF